MNTCGKCYFYEGGLTVNTTNADGSKKDSVPGGWCYGAPPSANLAQTSYPTVREDQRECALWRAKKGKTR